MVRFEVSEEENAAVDHVVLVLAAAPGVAQAARKALRLAHRRARRLTFLLVTTGGLSALDTACRRLVTTLATEPKRNIDVRLVVRTGDAAEALRNLTDQDAPDLVFVASTELGIFSTEVACPVVLLDRTKSLAPLAI